MRGRANSAASVSLLREEVRTLDADVPLYNISTLERLSQQSRWIQRALSSMLGLFAAIATLLSAMGLYAVTTYSISRRTSEIGIRMALGAQRRQVSWLFLRGTLVHVGLGLTWAWPARSRWGRCCAECSCRRTPSTRSPSQAWSCCWRWSRSLPAWCRRGVHRRWTL